MKKYAMVTGASRGIGRAVSLRLAACGYPLILIAHTDADGLSETARCAQAASGENPCSIREYLCDLSDAAAVSDLFARLAEEGIGHPSTCPDSISLLINNAGISHFSLVQDMTDLDWHHVIDTNLSSMFYTCRAVVPMMVATQAGVIINVSSVWGRLGASMESAYAASKGGVDAFTRSLMQELSPSGIRVHLIAPEFVDTDMNAHLSEAERMEAVQGMPSKRIWSAEEVAETIVACL